ncbi:hypothetical protein D3C78_1394960 [compost metagenome]
MGQRLQLTARAEAEAAATGDDQGLFALHQRLVLRDTVIQGVIEGQPKPHDLVDPGFQAAWHAEVVHRCGNHQYVMAEQLAHQRIAKRQICLHRQRTRIGFGVKRGGHEGFVDRRDQRPADFAASQFRLRVTGLPGRQKHFRQTSGVRPITPWTGMNRKNCVHLNLLGTKLKRLVACSLELIAALLQLNKNQSG